MRLNDRCNAAITSDLGGAKRLDLGIGERETGRGVSYSVRRHNNYAQHLPQRRVMMQAWAGSLDGLRTSGTTGGGQYRPLDAETRTLALGS